jgi:hypothetical protein
VKVGKASFRVGSSAAGAEWVLSDNYNYNYNWVVSDFNLKINGWNIR